MRVSVSVLGNRRKSVMNWFSVPICRLYPGLVCPFFMASSFMRMNVAPWIGLGIGVTFSKGIKVIVVFYQLVTIPFKFHDLLLLCAGLFSSLSFVAGWRSRASLSSSTMSESLQGVNSTDVSFIEFSVQWLHPPVPREYGFYPLVSYGSVRLSCARQKYICWL